MGQGYNPSVFCLRQNPPPFTQGRLKLLDKNTPTEKYSEQMFDFCSKSVDFKLNIYYTIGRNEADWIL